MATNFLFKPSRSFIPELKHAFEEKVRFGYGRTHLRNTLACQQIIDKLNLKSNFKPGEFDIVDANPGYGLFSSMLNYELQPRNHILIENKERCCIAWKKIIDHLDSLGYNHNLKLYEKDPYEWQTYTDLIQKDNLINPVKKSFDKLNDELLIIANWSGDKDESTIAQWIGCCGDRNWLMKYGKVKMIIFMPLPTARKFVALAGYKKRKRTGLKVDMFTESKLIAFSDVNIPCGNEFDPRVLVRDQPIPIEKQSSIRNDEFAVVEFSPGKLTSEMISNVDHLLLPIFLGHKTLRESIPIFAPGAEYMYKFLPDSTLNKTPYELEPKDILLLSEAYEKWPFKPTVEELYDIDLTSPA